jgi:N-acetylneuraminate synthase
MAVKIIAEIGCNHKGNIKIAKDLIKAAKRCGADVAKFQKRKNKLLLNKKEYESPHPEPWNSYGNTYGLHREALELNIDQHKELQDFCSTIGIEYTSSVWEIDSAKEISELNPLFIKVPSATNLDFKMQNFLCENYDGKIHVSVGMTKKKEIAEIINFYKKKSRINDLVLYCCTSGYPISEKDICLLEIKNLQKLMENTEGGVGFSGHHLGIAPDIAAVTLGVDWIERHFTLDRTWKGTDHAASLEPEGLRRLCRDIKNVEKALSYKEEDILTIEKVQRAKLKKCIFE